MSLSRVASDIVTFTGSFSGAAQTGNAVGYASLNLVRAFMTDGAPATNTSPSLPQPLGEMISQGNTAFVTTGNGFVALTLNPVEVLAEVTTGACQSLAIEGDNLHVLSGSYLRHYDVVDPTAPQPQASLLLSPVPVWARAAGPAHVATLTHDGVLNVYASPYGGPITEVGELVGPFRAPVGFESRGTIACILSADGFALIDLSDPADPRLVVEQKRLAMGIVRQCALTDQYLILASIEGLRLLPLPCDLALSPVDDEHPCRAGGDQCLSQSVQPAHDHPLRTRAAGRSPAGGLQPGRTPGAHPAEQRRTAGWAAQRRLDGRRRPGAFAGQRRVPGAVGGGREDRIKSGDPAALVGTITGSGRRHSWRGRWGWRAGRAEARTPANARLPGVPCWYSEKRNRNCR